MALSVQNPRLDKELIKVREHLKNIVIAISVLLLLITIILADFALIGAISSQSKVDSQKPILLGDVNMDNAINEEDLDMVHQHILQFEKLNKEQELRADMNQDGKISALDLLRIHKYIRYIGGE